MHVGMTALDSPFQVSSENKNSFIKKLITTSRDNVYFSSYFITFQRDYDTVVLHLS